jgi:hypothetical protein
VFPIYTDGLHSDVVHRGQYTPPDGYLSEMIRQSRARGFSVMLRPLIDEGNLQPGWRGSIAPTNPTAWFASYDSLIVMYAQLAQATGASVLAVGSELNSIETYLSAWDNLIAQIRQVFAGQVTYSFNWGTSFATALWPQLDFVSIDGYFPLDHTPIQATAAEMTVDWQRWVTVMKQADLRYGKPIVISELGVAPKTGSQRKPWDPSVSGTFDEEEQRAYYEAACQALRPAVAGLYWWFAGPVLPTNLTPNDYNPLGRPAEQEVARCYSRK